MRRYNVSRSTAEWNRIAAALEGRAIDPTALPQLAADIRQMLRHDDAHVHGDDPGLPVGVTRDDS